jgi:hypothetical protein
MAYVPHRILSSEMGLRGTTVKDTMPGWSRSLLGAALGVTVSLLMFKVWLGKLLRTAVECRHSSHDGGR